MWRYPDETQVCLECYHKDKDRKPRKLAFDETKLATESKTGHYAMKAAGSLAAAFALLVGGIYLFYKPHPTTPLAKTTEAEKEPEKAPDSKKSDKPKDDVEAPADADKTAGTDDAPAKPSETADQKPEETKGDKKAATVATATAAGAKTERIAPTVQALTANLPQNQPQNQGQKGAPVPNVIGQFVDKANSAAAALQSSSPPTQTGSLHPNEKTKAKVEETKTAVMAMATALIDKNDPDGTKAADALAKLGSVSSAFAEVAGRLAPPAPLKESSGGSGGANSAAPANNHLEADVLESQGRAGYDPVEATNRESQDGGSAPTTVAVQKDPNAAQPKSGTVITSPSGGTIGTAGTAASATAANQALLAARKTATLSAQNAAASLKPAMESGGAVATGVAPDSTTLVMAAGPSNPGAAAQPTASAAPAVAAAAPMMAVARPGVVMSMRGDLLFDYNSAAMRPEAATQLAEVARALSMHPDLPVVVRGYSDSKGSPSANHLLSRKRAEAVRDWLVAKIGNQAQNILALGLGSSDPVQPNRNPNGSDNPAGREKNRRVTVTIAEQPAASAFRQGAEQGLRADAR